MSDHYLDVITIIRLIHPVPQTEGERDTYVDIEKGKVRKEAQIVKS